MNERERLEREHHKDVIAARIGGARNHSYLGDAVLGAVDGCVTTFAVVAGSLGAGFSSTVVVILGLANLIADGFSMAASNYLGTKSDREMVDRARAEEISHIEMIPSGEREEIRQIFAQKGFAGETLENIVEVITGSRELWVNTMITEEHGLSLDGPSAWKAGVATFLAFAAAGTIPLLPYLLPGEGERFAWSAGATGATFLGVGLLKGRILQQRALRSGIETLLIGGGAASLAYAAGAVLKQVFNIG